METALPASADDVAARLVAQVARVAEEGSDVVGRRRQADLHDYNSTDRAVGGRLAVGLAPCLTGC